MLYNYLIGDCKLKMIDTKNDWSAMLYVCDNLHQRQVLFIYDLINGKVISS